MRAQASPISVCCNTPTLASTVVGRVEPIARAIAPAGLLYDQRPRGTAMYCVPGSAAADPLSVPAAATASSIRSIGSSARSKSSSRRVAVPIPTRTGVRAGVFIDPCGRRP